ncbi:MAG: hypothetical protein FJ387_14560 [Verrucomicrobia bacterium]|nr:hypothetical protein [Verrucomicrobiota bacterium]
MNHEGQVKLQAWLDGELPESEARTLARRVQEDPAARALTDALSQVKHALQAGEPEWRVPESREFYWSKIQRDILRQERPEARPPRSRWTGSWFKYLAPAAIVGALALLISMPELLFGPSTSGSVLTAEVDTPREDVSSFTFRSEAEGMTVVWIDTR